MSSWVSVWTPLSFAFSWAALNLASGVAGDWSETLGLCGGFLGGGDGGSTELVLVGTGSFLIGGGGDFTAVTLAALLEAFLTGSGPGFTELAWVGCGSGDGRDFA